MLWHALHFSPSETAGVWGVRARAVVLELLYNSAALGKGQDRMLLPLKV